MRKKFRYRPHDYDGFLRWEILEWGGLVYCYASGEHHAKEIVNALNAQYEKGKTKS